MRAFYGRNVRLTSPVPTSAPPRRAAIPDPIESIMRIPAIFTVLAAVLALGACERGGTGLGDGGEYRAVLESPNGAEGAVALELTGPGVESIEAGTGTLHTQPASPTSTRVVLIQEPAGPIEFRVTMAAGQAPPAVRVVEVVDGSDQPRPSLDGYRVTFSR
jgi:hypothetical protein